MQKKEIYIVISQTGTILSRMLKRITHDEYNHASLSVDSNLDIMFSFGRKNAYCPWLGGFVKESTRFGTLKRFSETTVRVLAVAVSEEIFDEINRELHQMYNNKFDYHYDAIGLICAGFKKVYRRKNYFYCSEFVRDILVRFGVEDPELFPEIVRPVNFLDIPNASEIYRGKLREFSKVAVNE